ncbi:13691_t:CDS:1, partial [Funneliformis geosporum]
LNGVIFSFTTQTVRDVNSFFILEFKIEERLVDREPNKYILEVKHDLDNTYFANKTNAINQTIRLTTAILIDVIDYEPP